MYMVKKAIQDPQLQQSDNLHNDVQEILPHKSVNHPQQLCHQKITPIYP